MTPEKALFWEPNCGARVLFRSLAGASSPKSAHSGLGRNLELRGHMFQFQASNAFGVSRYRPARVQILTWPQEMPAKAQS